MSGKDQLKYDQVGRGGLDYKDYLYEQTRIEKDLDDIKDDGMCRKDLLMNVKMYDDSMKEMEMIKDRLGLWRESLNGLNESIGRDGLYVKEIAMKVVERKVDELMNERKMVLKRMTDKLENFMSLMKTSMDCMSNSIIEFEKDVYNMGENGDYLAFDHKSCNRICSSYYQLSQRLKEYLKNISPYFKGNLDTELIPSTDFDFNSNNHIWGEDMSHFVSFGNNLGNTENEHGELKSIILQESKLLRDPVILMIDPKKMQTINLRGKINRSDLDGIISCSVTLNSSTDNDFPTNSSIDQSQSNNHRNINTETKAPNPKRPDPKHSINISNNNDSNAHPKGEDYNSNDEKNMYFDTDVSISIKGVKGRPKERSLDDHPKARSGSRSRPRPRPRSISRSRSKSKPRSVSEPKISFKREHEFSDDQSEYCFDSESESDTASQSESEPESYVKKGTIYAGNDSGCFEKTRSSKSYPSSKSKHQHSSRKRNKGCGTSHKTSTRSRYCFSSSSDFDSEDEANFNSRSTKSEAELKDLIRDYSILYAEYIVSKNLSRISGLY
ncbi:hypothetical protein OIY81_2214 [Cryptosporidium canis]|nr:hypothetical protein OIY81_2214 [Cryptosporidium canis]